MAERKKVGELLVEAKIITPTQLTSALAHQRQWGGRLGSALIEKGFITEEVLAKFLSFQLNFPSVNLAKIQVAPEVLAKVPREMQEKHMCIPIAVMKEGRTDALILAIADPTDLRSIDEIGFATGLKIKPVIATESALKRFLYGATPGSGRNVNAGVTSGIRTVNERTDEFEVVRGVAAAAPVPEPSVSQPQALGVVGEETIDFGGDELILETEVEPQAVVHGRISDAPPAAPAAVVAPPAPPAGADPFAAALVARASGGAMPVATAVPAPTPTPTVLGSPIPSGPPRIEGSYPTLDPGALAPVSLAANPAGAIPTDAFETDDRTEPDIVVAGGSPPSIAEPEPAPWDAPPPSMPSREEVAAAERTDVEPVSAEPEPSLLDAWTEPPPQESAQEPVDEAEPREILATGAIPTDEAVPEISLPGPEMLPPPAELLAPSPVPADPALTPSKIFSIPEDVPIAESSVRAPVEEAWAEAPPAPAPQPPPPADDTVWPEADGAASFDPGVETGFEPTVPDSEMPPPEPAASLEPPVESMAPAEPPSDAVTAADAETGPAMASELPPPPEPPVESFASDAPEMPAETTGGDATDTAPSPVPPALAADGGSSMPADLVDDEKTVIGSGAMEPTWTGEVPLPEPRMPDKTQLGAGAAEPMWTSPEVTATAEGLPDRGADHETSSDRETVESFELPPPKPAPPPAAKLEPPKPPAPPPPPPPAPAAPPVVETSEASRPPVAVGISEEQAQLNAMITKKLKLLNAIAELLLEKGVITEDEIKDKIAKKK